VNPEAGPAFPAENVQVGAVLLPIKGRRGKLTFLLIGSRVMAARAHSANQALLYMRRQNVLNELTEVCQKIAQTQKQITRLEKRILSLVKARKKVA
jgi:hypothetical protein